MKNRKLFKASACGAGFAAICCFTPFLVVLLPAVGLGAWLAWADYVLWPLLAVSLGGMVYALWVHQRSRGARCANDDEGANP